MKIKKGALFGIIMKVVNYIYKCMAGLSSQWAQLIIDHVKVIEMTECSLICYENNHIPVTVSADVSATTTGLRNAFTS